MAENVKVCGIDEDLAAKMKKFRFRKEKTNSALILKINSEKQMVELEEEIEDCTLDEVGEELPGHQPRYVVFSYCYSHDDGRISYPLCFIFVTPVGCKPELNMMYAGTKLSLINEGGFTKVFELRSTEEMTEEWLKEKLKFFR